MPSVSLRKGDQVHRQGKPYAVATIMKIEQRPEGRFCHVVGVPERAEPFSDTWPYAECVLAAR